MKLISEVVEFRDGTSLTVTEANWEADMRVSLMERDSAVQGEKLMQEALKSSTNPPLPFIMFMQNIYPKMAACSTGDVPSAEDAFLMPSVERDKWYEAVRRVNPAWFVAFDAYVAKTEDELKKKGMMPTMSTTV